MKTKYSAINAQSKFNKMAKTLKSQVEAKGFRQKDKRLNRVTHNLPGHFLVVNEPMIMKWIKERPVDMGLYEGDFKRMKPSLKIAIERAIEDVASRRLMVFNVDDYEKVFECFTNLHFVWTARKEFDLYVYQRSSDMTKLLDDLTFFGYISKLFEDDVNKKVTKIVIVFGSIHYEID